MAKYVEVGRAVRAMMLRADAAGRAAVDRRGLSRSHRHRAAARHERRQGAGALRACQVERELGITVSIGLSANKFLAKIASDMDKPRGFAVLGQDEAVAFLAAKPVGFIYGVGAVSAAKLAADGYRLIADLQRAEEHDLMRRYGEEGARLWRLARGIDARNVDPERDTKSISAETTFERDIGELRPLEQTLWELTERVSRRLKAAALAGSTVTLKLKSADFKIRTRARALGAPTQLAARIYRRRPRSARARGRRHALSPDRHRRQPIGRRRRRRSRRSHRPPQRAGRTRGRPAAREIRPRRGGEGPGDRGGVTGSGLSRPVATDRASPSSGRARSTRRTA